MKHQNENRGAEENDAWADAVRTIETIESIDPVDGNTANVIEYELITLPAKRTSFARRVGRNAIPVALLGVGLAWLAAALRESAGQQSGTQHGQPYRNVTVGDETAKLSGHGGMGSSESMLNRTTGRASEAGREIRQRASAAGQDLREKAIVASQELRNQAVVAKQELSRRAIVARRELGYKATEIGERLSFSASEVNKRAKQMKERAAIQIQDTVEQTQARLGEFSQQSQTQYYRAKQNAGRLIEEQPLVVAALGAAVGAALAAAIPSTRRENELLGQTRDNLFERAKTTAWEQAEALKESAQRVTRVAKEKAANVVQVAKDEAENVVEVAKDEVEHVKANESAQSSQKKQ